MADWFEFYLFAIRQAITNINTFFPIGLGFSLVDLEVALMLIGLVASAFVAKFSHLGVRHDFNIGSGSGPKHND